MDFMVGMDDVDTILMRSSLYSEYRRWYRWRFLYYWTLLCEAIHAANGDGIASRIEFNIPGMAPHQILLTGPFLM